MPPDSLFGHSNRWQKLKNIFCCKNNTIKNNSEHYQRTNDSQSIKESANLAKEASIDDDNLDKPSLNHWLKNSSLQPSNKKNEFIVLTAASSTHLEDSSRQAYNDTLGHRLLHSGLSAFENGNFELAKHYYEKAAEKHEPVGIHNLGIMLLFGQGIPVDYNRAYECFMACSSFGLSASMGQLGYMYMYGYGVDKSYTKAKTWFELSNEAGNEPYSQYHLAVLYLRGLGVPMNKFVGRNWLIKSANGGYIPAIFDLAVIYGIEENIDSAKLYRKSITNGSHAPSQNNLGVLFVTGDCGIRRHDKRAINLFKLAARQGLSEALYNLGEAYIYGIGVSKDVLRGARYYYQATKTGSNGDAEYQLGNLFLHGYRNSIKPSESIALYWFERALRKGNRAARNNYFVLKRTCMESKKRSLEILENHMLYKQHVY